MKSRLKAWLIKGKKPKSIPRWEKVPLQQKIIISKRGKDWVLKTLPKAKLELWLILIMFRTRVHINRGTGKFKIAVLINRE